MLNSFILILRKGWRLMQTPKQTNRVDTACSTITRLHRNAGNVIYSAIQFNGGRLNRLILLN